MRTTAQPLAGVVLLALVACTETGRTFDIELSAYAGEGLHVGVHDATTPPWAARR